MRDIDRYQSDYVSTYGFEAQLVRYRRRQALMCLEQYPHRHILEIGCGIDPYANYIKDWDTYTIVEPARAFATQARAISGNAGRVVVHEATIEEVAPNLRDQHFDFILLSSLIHEVRQPLDLLRAVHSLCSHDTIVHANVPNARSLHNRLGLHMGIIPHVFVKSPLADRMQRTSTYDAASLSALAAEAGFKTESHGSYFLKPFTNDQMQQMLDQRIIGVDVLDALFEVNREFTDVGAEIYVNLRRTNSRDDPLDAPDHR